MAFTWVAIDEWWWWWWRRWDTGSQSHKKTYIYKIYNSPTIINNTAQDKSIKSIGWDETMSRSEMAHASDNATMAHQWMQRDIHSTTLQNRLKLNIIFSAHTRNTGRISPQRLNFGPPTYPLICLVRRPTLWHKFPYSQLSPECDQTLRTHTGEKRS